MNIYKDKCPFCGAFISISNASVCPGCNSRIYHGPTADIEDSWSYYWPDEYQRTQAGEARAKNFKSRRAFEESAEGIEYRRKLKEEDLALKSKLVTKQYQANSGILLIFSIIPVWFFGGHEWDNFGVYGWPALLLGSFLLWRGDVF